MITPSSFLPQSLRILSLSLTQTSPSPLKAASFPSRLSATPALSSFVSGDRSGVGHPISITSPFKLCFGHNDPCQRSRLCLNRRALWHERNADNDDNDHDDDDVPPAPPLSSPLPPHVFARVRPNIWLTALSAPTAPRRDWNERGNTTLRVSAWFADVPLEVLPGRESEFCSFVSKVIFGRREGAVAGVRGVTAVGVRVEGSSIDESEGEGEGGDDDDEGTGRGVDGGLVLTGLPFQGSVSGGKGCGENGCCARGPCVLLSLALLFVCE
ncbi:hypothetical protein BJV78DRAFT_1361474 [Lactifluus subvellereus]|nr:hypothetical protein BJV78DRAFT_1361474 [Lactifluus subvellereus]